MSGFSRTQLRHLREGHPEAQDENNQNVFPVDSWQDLEPTRIKAIAHAKTRGLLLETHDNNEADDMTEDLLLKQHWSPFKDITLQASETTGISIRIPCSLLASCTAKRLAALNKITDSAILDPASPGVAQLQQDIYQLGLDHGSEYCDKALKQYSVYMQTKRFNSRMVVQDHDGYYSAEFQLACIALGCLLGDWGFSFLAKVEFHHAFVDATDKWQTLGLEHFRKLFKLTPFTNSVVGTFRNKMIARNLKKQSSDLWDQITEAWPTSWSNVPQQYPWISKEGILSGAKASYQRTLPAEIETDQSMFFPEDDATAAKPDIEDSTNSCPPTPEATPEPGNAKMAGPTDATNPVQSLAPKRKREETGLQTPINNGGPPTQTAPEAPSSKPTFIEPPLVDIKQARLTVNASSPRLVACDKTGTVYKRVKTPRDYAVFAPRTGKKRYDYVAVKKEEESGFLATYASTLFAK